MKAFCVTPVTDDRKHLLEKTGVEITFIEKQEVTPEVLQGAEIIFGNLSPQLINTIDSIRWVQLDSAGADSYKGLRDDITLTNCSGGKPSANTCLAAYWQWKRICMPITTGRRNVPGKTSVLYL